MMNLTIRMLTRKILYYKNVDKNATIGFLQSLYANDSGVSVIKLRLIYAGRPIENARTVKWYDLRQESHIYVIRLLCGGPRTLTAVRMKNGVLLSSCEEEVYEKEVFEKKGF